MAPYQPQYAREPVPEQPPVRRATPHPVARQQRPAGPLTSRDRILYLQRTVGNRITHQAIQRLGSRAAPGDLAGPIRARLGAGHPLDAAVRRRLEEDLEADLTQVRIHTDAEADDLAGAVDADAFTTGADIFFSAGAYDPHATAGWHLLAHEAAHTVQQAVEPVTGHPHPGGIIVSDPGDRFEQAADASARRAATAPPARLAGERPHGPVPGGRGSLARRAPAPLVVQRGKGKKKAEKLLKDNGLKGVTKTKALGILKGVNQTNFNSLQPLVNAWNKVNTNSSDEISMGDVVGEKKLPRRTSRERGEKAVEKEKVRAQELADEMSLSSEDTPSDTDDTDFDIAEIEEAEEPDEFMADPLYSRPGWTAATKKWAKDQAKKQQTCPFCKTSINTMIPRPSSQAKNKGKMRVGFDIDHHVIKWSDRVAAMKDIELKTPNSIDRATVKTVYNSKLRLMCPACNTSHQHEPKTKGQFKLHEYDGTP